MYTLSTTPDPDPPEDECPKGGSHDWRHDGYLRTCTKCGQSEPSH